MNGIIPIFRLSLIFIPKKESPYRSESGVSSSGIMIPLFQVE
jgi:hypothetical protein